MQNIRKVCSNGTNEEGKVQLWKEQHRQKSCLEKQGGELGTILHVELANVEFIISRTSFKLCNGFQSRK